MTAQDIVELREGYLARHNINWDPDAVFITDLDAAITEAASSIRKIAGNPDLPLLSDSIRGLVIEYAWYIKEHRKPEFEEDYASDLLLLRLTEGFDCGKDQENLV